MSGWSVVGTGERVVLRDALLPGGRRVDVHIVDGRIADVVPTGTAPAPPPEPPVTGDTSEDFGRGDTSDPWHGAVVHDLAGWLLLPAMAEPHAHLDKALTAELVPNPSGDLLGAIEAWTTASAGGVLTPEGVEARTVAALELLLVRGVTAVRSHVNVTGVAGVTNLLAVRRAADRLAGLIDVELVALTDVPTTGPDGAATRRALDQAVEHGVDVVGGCPHLDPDPAALIAHALAVAEQAGLAVDLHVDEQLDPAVMTLRELARQVVAGEVAVSVTASHCVSLGMQTPSEQARIAEEVAAAGVAVVTLPQTNLFLQGRDHPTATPRGLTAIAALLEAGASVAAGGDNVQDPFNLVGRSDPLETAALMVMAGHRLPDEAYHLVSNGPRAIMGLEPVRIEPGDPADLVAIAAPSIRAAVADAPMARRVFRQGRLVASCDEQRTIHR
ncbi:MAG: amidohydrolase family protein [Acidimicrobiales bacterium]